MPDHPDSMSGEREGRHSPVDEGVAIMRAWARYFGVDEMTTTVIVPPDFSAGYLAALDATKSTRDRVEAELREAREQPNDGRLSRNEALGQLEAVAKELPCPHSPWCESCECAAEDDACFPDEAVRALKVERDSAQARVSQLEEGLRGIVDRFYGLASGEGVRADWERCMKALDAGRRVLSESEEK